MAQSITTARVSLRTILLKLNSDFISTHSALTFFGQPRPNFICFFFFENSANIDLDFKILPQEFAFSIFDL